MTPFTVYDPVSGAILRTGTVFSDADVASQAGPSEAVLSGQQGNRRTQRVELVEGVPTLVALVPPAPTLADLKAAALAQLAARRWQVETSGVTVAGALIATDRESQATLNGALTYLSLGLQASVKWKTETGTFVDADLMTIRGFASAVGQHVQACFAREAELAAAIDGAVDATGLTAVVAQIQPFFAS
jgi:hypothetical protein